MPFRPVTYTTVSGREISDASPDLTLARSEKWQMLYNYGKCKCLHSGHRNEDAQYTMGDTVLNTTVKKKD